MSYARWGSPGDWYIFWHCESGDTLESQKLAVWPAKCEMSCPLYEYDEIKHALAENDFTGIEGFSEIGEQGHLRECLEAWIEEVEDEELPTEATS